MLTFVAFFVAISVLVTVHEWGHFVAARACGVRILRFSVGFGPRIMGWTSRKSGTEYVIGALPLGGYVKMLDEQDGLLTPSDKRTAFNNQALHRKFAIVIAGPFANLLLAVVLYSAVNWMGMLQPLAILSAPSPKSTLSNLGFSGGELILRAAFEGDDLEEVVSFENFRWWLAKGAVEHRNVQVNYKAPRESEVRSALLMLVEVDSSGTDGQFLRKFGVTAPFSAARLGNLLPDGAAARARLMTGDLVLSVDETKIVDAGQLRDLIRASGHFGIPRGQSWQVMRNGETLSILVEPIQVRAGDESIGRVGAEIGEQPAMDMVRYGPLGGVTEAIRRTWDTSILTLRVMGKIVIGSASLNNVSGPITIADYAGKSAAMGFAQFFLFLAVMSVSLGILNLLPLPILDGGHLMYYLWEALSGKPVARLWNERLQKVGLIILLMMMSVAIVNDVTRLLP
jgi:regulator of sigma E protease